MTRKRKKVCKPTGKRVRIGGKQYSVSLCGDEVQLCTVSGKRSCRRVPRGLSGVDTYAVTEDGRVRHAKGAMGPSKSQMFTWTSKVHAPSWGVPPVASCPAVCKPIAAKMRKKPKGSYTKEEVEEILKDVPKKCLSCYGFEAGKYGLGEVKQALRRRFEWFQSADEDDVVASLVKAIKVSGRERCRVNRAKRSDPWKKHGKTYSRQDTLICEKDNMATPTHFRLFDVGDFSSARDVRIWRKVAEKMPQVRFWAPTTTWTQMSTLRGFRKELAKMARMKNVAVKPSAVLVGEGAKELKLNGTRAAGSGVVEWRRGKTRTTNCPWTRKGKKPKECVRSTRKLIGVTDKRGKPIWYDPMDDATRPRTVYLNGRKHALCQGNCAKCRACWNKKLPILYIHHGPKVEKGEVSPKRKRKFVEYTRELLIRNKEIKPQR